MATETSEDLVKRLMSEIRAHGKAMEAASAGYERRDSGPGQEEVRDIDIYDNNATFVIRKPVDRKPDHTFLTGNSSGLVNGKILPSTSSSSVYQNSNQHYHHHQQTPILSTFHPHPPSTTSNPCSLASVNKFSGSSLNTTPTTIVNNRSYNSSQITVPTSPGTGLTFKPLTASVKNDNLNKGESDLSCYSSISSTAGVDQRVESARSNQVKCSLNVSGQSMHQSNSEPHCPSCGNVTIKNSDPISSDPYLTPNGVTLKSPGNRPSAVNDRFLGHSVVKCDHVGPISTPEDPPRYSPCKVHNNSHANVHHYQHHHNHSAERMTPKFTLPPIPKVQFFGKLTNQASPNRFNGKQAKAGYPLKYIKKVHRCPACSGKCYIEPVNRSVNHLSLSGGDNLFTIYCPSCSKSGLTRLKGPVENGNYILNGAIDKHLTYYSALPRLWDTEMWHRKRKRASIRKNEKILIVFTSIVSLIIFLTLTYLGVTTFQKITELPKIG